MGWNKSRFLEINLSVFLISVSFLVRKLISYTAYSKNVFGGRINVRKGKWLNKYCYNYKMKYYLANLDVCYWGVFFPKSLGEMPKVRA